MHRGVSFNPNLFFLAHIFFLVVFVALVWALVVVIRKQREPKALLLSILPLVLIFTTTYFATRIPTAHQVINIFYDALLIFNAFYFWKNGPSPTGPLYLASVIGTALDFAMHFIVM
jgi:heme A synthase